MVPGLWLKTPVSLLFCGSQDMPQEHGKRMEQLLIPSIFREENIWSVFIMLKTTR